MYWKLPVAMSVILYLLSRFIFWLSLRQILSHSNDTVSLTFTQLGAANGLHLLGSTRGMLPIGPNGIPVFDTLLPSPFTKTAADSFLPYNYSLDLQGIFRDVSCFYEIDSPVNFSLPFPSVSYVYQFNGTCPPGQDFLGTPVWTTIASNNTLGFWACQLSTSGDLYNVYLRGIKKYIASIGNVTCIVGPVQPAVFKLDYTGKSGVFNSTQVAISTSPGTSTELIRRAVGALGNVRDLSHTLYNSNLMFCFVFRLFGKHKMRNRTW